MQAQTTVTLYVANRLDGALEVEPADLAAEFVQSFQEGFELPQRGSLEFAYRWWLSVTEGRNATWDEKDWDAIIDALAAYLADKPDIKDGLWEWVCPS